MASISSKRSNSSAEEVSLSDGGSSHGEDEKTIPFLRRLRDLLCENEDVISFAPGRYSGSNKVLGRIVVHDRVQVESKVLPRYFNHSSFASLRRQLNYFSFVRLGKGRQRESTYVNENVVVLDDLLQLRRRATTTNSSSTAVKEQLISTVADGVGSRDTNTDALNLSAETRDSVLVRSKRRRIASKPAPTTVSPRSVSPQNIISEDDEHWDTKHSVALDLTGTKPNLYETADTEVLLGCKNLLTLASLGWD